MTTTTRGIAARLHYRLLKHSFFNLLYTLYLTRVHIPGTCERDARTRLYSLRSRPGADTQVAAPLQRNNYNRRVARVHDCQSFSSTVHQRRTELTLKRRTPRIGDKRRYHHPSQGRVCRLPTTRVGVRTTVRQTHETLPSKMPDARITGTGYAALLSKGPRGPIYVAQTTIQHRGSVTGRIIRH